MDPRDTYPRPPPTGETWSTPGLWQWIFEKNYELARDVSAVLANQQTNKADILEHLRRDRQHHDQRLDDFKNEIFPRLERWEARIEEVHDKVLAASPPAPESSLAKSLFGSIGVMLWNVLPWKHIGMMLPAILLAVTTNVAPKGTREFVAGVWELVKVYWKTQSP